MIAAARSLLLVSLLAAAASAAGAPPESSIDLEEARVVFAEAQRLSDADGGELWGRRLYGPILLVDPATRHVVSNVPDRKRHFTKHDDDLYVGRLPDAVGIANTTTEWAGRQWTMLMWPLPGEPTWRGALLMHECFHRIQARLGLPLSAPDNHHLDTAEGRLWMRLEWRALVEALQDPEPLQTEAIRDALVFRAYRRSLFGAAAAQENALEVNEGLAEYTGLRLGGADAETQRARAILGLQRYDRSGALVRTFAYASGPGWGLILDEARPGWHRAMRTKGDFGELLARAIRFRMPKELETEAQKRAAMFDYESLVAEEREREDARQARIDADYARYVEAPVLIIELGGGINYSFSPHDMHALDGIGTVHGTMHLSGPWGILDVHDGALVTSEERGGRRRVHVPAPENPTARPLAGGGWTLHLEPAWRLAPGPRDGDYVVAKRR